MEEALSLALAAQEEGEVPVGAVVEKNGIVVGMGSNQQVRDNDPTGHAEMVALRDASRTLNNFRLDGCNMYVTVEPCKMCREAIIRARINEVFYAAPAAKEATHKTLFIEDIKNKERAGDMMKSFFSKKR